ncbi:NAD(P)H-binding protein [Streptomyces sp. B6B3]|uniref:SDR family oxidoreductase n=1 Tax=Streptomyces sp. B6B3 TaxID=3153570 RepID=UPI00325E702A
MDTKRIAVTGGTGTLGRLLVAELGRRGHEVRVLSRSSGEHPIDLDTGAGLAEALDGCEVVVDASNNRSAKRAPRTMVEGARRLLEAERAAGVGHHVCVSIVGCDRLPSGYFRVKADQERVVTEGSVPWSVVRATQFHEMMDEMFALGARMRLLPVPRARMRTVAAVEAAGVIAGVAEGEPLLDRIEVGGPEETELRDLARTWRSVTGRRTLLLRVPVPGGFGRALREGVAVPDAPDAVGRTPFGGWLIERQAHRKEQAQRAREARRVKEARVRKASVRKAGVKEARVEEARVEEAQRR